MTLIDTSTEAVEQVAKTVAHEGCGNSDRFQAAEYLRTLAAERDTATRQAEDCARECAKLAEEIQRLHGQLAEAYGYRGALQQIFARSSQARPAYYESAILKIEEISENALKSAPAPRQTVQEAAKVLLDPTNKQEIWDAFGGAGIINSMLIDNALRALALEARDA